MWNLIPKKVVAFFGCVVLVLFLTAAESGCPSTSSGGSQYQPAPAAAQPLQTAEIDFQGKKLGDFVLTADHTLEFDGQRPTWNTIYTGDIYSNNIILSNSGAGLVAIQFYSRTTDSTGQITGFSLGAIEACGQYTCPSQ